jgi:hypothetical protein
MEAEHMAEVLQSALDCIRYVAKAGDASAVTWLVGRGFRIDVSCSYCGALDNASCEYPSEGKPGCLVVSDRGGVRRLLDGDRDRATMADAVLYAIVHDLGNRSRLGSALATLDADAVRDILATWRGYILAAIPP